MIPSIQSLETEVLIIGGGLAGLRAAIESAKNGVKTTVVSKSPIMTGSNSILAGGGLSIAASEIDMEKHIKETIHIGKNINDQELVVEFARGGLKEVEFLRTVGIDLLSKPPFGYWVNKRDYPDKMLGGRILVKKLILEALKYKHIQFLPGFFVYKILSQDDQVTGVIGFNIDKPYLISSKAIVLATGGGAAIYKRNDNHKKMVGDGYALALEINLPLVDMEFVQFYPFGFAEPGLPQTIIYPPFPNEVRILDSKGEDFLRKHSIEKSLDELIVTLRDRVCYLIYKEAQVGKVSMDYTHVPDEKWKEYPLSLFPQRKFNFKENAFRVAPLAHFFMGGVKIKPSCETDIKGFFAAGEVTGGVHGANRMGGNALAECLVFGAKSGQWAAEYAKSGISKKGFNVPEGWPGTLLVGTPGIKNTPRLLAALRAVRDLAWKCAGPVRNEKQMRKGLSAIEAWREKIKVLSVSQVRDLILKRELENSLLVLEAILSSSLARMESRGAFQREDYPQEGGSEFLRRISVRMQTPDGDLEVNREDSN